MARHDVSRRPSRHKEVDAVAQVKKESGTKPEEMLPRLLVRFGVVVVIVALSALTMAIQPHLSTPIASHDSNTMEEAKTETKADERTKTGKTGSRPMVEVLAKYPHDATAFTQGFMIIPRGEKKKIFIESTGLYGESSLRHVEIESGKVLKQYNFPKQFFGEGVTLGPENELVMLTWKSQMGFVFKVDETIDATVNGFTVKNDFRFETVTGEGWGITYDGQDLIVSDGSSTLMFWDPVTKQEKRRVVVTINNGQQEIAYLNELELANGFIYANVYYQPYILKIDPQSGAVMTIYDLSKLIADVGVDLSTGAVLNGIAYDSADDVFYVTGKLWTSVYKVRLV